MKNSKWNLDKKTRWSNYSIAHTINEIINQHFNKKEESNITEIQEILFESCECADLFDNDGFAEITLSELNMIIENTIGVFVDRRN